MGLQSSRGKEGKSANLIGVKNTANLGSTFGGGGGGGATATQFNMIPMTPTGLDPAGITTHNSLNENNYPFRWQSWRPDFEYMPDAQLPAWSDKTGYGSKGGMWKFTSEYAGDIHVYMWGGGGGAAQGTGGKSGCGGFASATLTVTSGQTLWVVQGEGGYGKFDPDEPYNDTTYTTYGDIGNRSGGGGPRAYGGGFSGIFVGSTVADVDQSKAVLMAGGGGGAGGNNTWGTWGAHGGGPQGMPGADASDNNCRGGTQTEGGQGGNAPAPTRAPGGPGAKLVGGGHYLAADPTWNPQVPTNPYSPLSGGGGGYFGGGAIGDNNSQGGAGGSGYIGGHPQCPVADAKWAMMPSPYDDTYFPSPNNSWGNNSDSWATYSPKTLRQGAGEGGYGPGNQSIQRTKGAYGKPGLVIIETRVPE